MNALLKLVIGSAATVSFVQFFWPNLTQSLFNVFVKISVASINLIVPLLNSIPMPSAFQSFTLPVAPDSVYAYMDALGFNTAISLIGTGIMVRMVRKVIFR